MPEKAHSKLRLLWLLPAAMLVTAVVAIYLANKTPAAAPETQSPDTEVFATVAATAATTVPPVSTAPPETQPPETGYTGTVNTESLRVRRGPGTGYAVLDSLTEGTVVTVTDFITDGENRWGKLAEGDGWICIDYVTFSTEDVPIPLTAEERAVADIEAFASDNGLTVDDYPEALIALLIRNPETADYVLSYPLEKDKAHDVDLSEWDDCDSVPLFLQWDKRWGYTTYAGEPAGLSACGPMALAMAGYYLTKDPVFAPDSVISFATEYGYGVNGSGSSWSLIYEGGEILGLEVSELYVSEAQIAETLEAGYPIICLMSPGDFTTSGHFIVLTEYVEGKLRVNDSNSRLRSEKTWRYDDICDQISIAWAIRP